MAEQTFFNENGVTVTNSRFITPGQTYAMSGVTSIRKLKITPSYKAPIITAIIGFISLGFGDSGIAIGILLIIAGIAWFILNKPTFVVVLSSASGEQEALSSKDEEFISRVVNALNEAIVARG